jgi:hypothetical protein
MLKILAYAFVITLLTEYQSNTHLLEQHKIFYIQAQVYPSLSHYKSFPYMYLTNMPIFRAGLLSKYNNLYTFLMTMKYA